MTFDVIILGAGYLGCSAALALSRMGLKVALFGPVRIEAKPHEAARLFAISSGSIDIFNEKVGVNFQELGGEINFIRVMDGEGRGYLDFDPAEIGLGNFGVMIDETDLSKFLATKVEAEPHITWNKTGRAIELIKNDDVAVQIKLDDQSTISANLLLVCEGKKSDFRDMLGIETFIHDYNQKAVIADVRHEHAHGGVAIENFLSSGPFAILPKSDQHVCSIVWTLETSSAEDVLQMDKDVVEMLVADRFGDYLGKTEIISDLAAFPLQLRYAKQYYEGRCYLLGDALHAIHPLAGQGLNLSMRDLEFIISAVEKSLSCGLDIGMNAVLQNYEKERAGDNAIMYEATSIINALFSNDNPVLKAVRNIGLDVVRGMPVLNRVFMRYAANGDK